MTVAGAWEEANALGHGWIGPEHFLLALVRPGTTSSAARVLRESGAGYERLRSRLALGTKELEPPAPTHDNPQPNPAAYALLGRAEAFAAANGSTVAAEHVLLALLWHPNAISSGLLDAAAGGRETVWRRMGEAGIGVPPEAPPPDDHRPMKRVDVRRADLERIVRRLPPLLPQGSPFGFNRHGERAWIVVGRDVDVEPLLREALRASA